MINLDEMSRNIEKKREDRLDGDFSLDKLSLNQYDIRTERDTRQMMETLKRDGQLEPLTITMNGYKNIIINGKTRFMAMREEPRLFLKVKCKVYKDLDQLEQNYLNAITNTFQKTLTTDEKLRFVQQHKTQLDRKALSQALGLTNGQVESYLRVSELPEEVIEDCKTRKKGRERGSTEIETASLIARNKNRDVQKLLASHAKTLIGKGTTDRERRTEIREKVKKINELSQHKEMLKMSEPEIARMVIERPRNTLRSLLKIAEGSEGKYKAFCDLLESENFEEVIIFNPTTPYLVNSPTSKSEALMTIEFAREKSFSIILVERSQACADLWRKEILNDKNVKVISVSAEEYLVTQFMSSMKKTLLYFNLAGDRNDREFYSKASFDSIKVKRPHFSNV